MAKNHAKRMIARPAFFTLSEDELNQAQLVLETALQDVRAARKLIEKKISETEL